MVTHPFQAEHVLIQNQPLPYEADLASRPLKQIELLVIHCTELPDIPLARVYGEKIHYASGTGNSGHYYINKEGTVLQWVKPEKIAHHVKGHNQQSIGVELVNLGRYPNWHHSGQQNCTDPYPSTQISSLIQLTLHLCQLLPNLKHIAGHEDLDSTTILATDDPNTTVQRKIDPGPMFPWSQVMKNIPLINIGSNAKSYE